MDEDGAFVPLGAPAAVAFTEVKEKVRGVLMCELQPTKAIWEALDEPRPSQDVVLRALDALAKCGEAV
jgi:hypothetical protein